MEKKFLYPFSSLTKDEIIKIDKNIMFKVNNGRIDFYVNENKLEEDELYIAMVSYIKLIAILMKNYKGNDMDNYINSIITSIQDDIINRIVDLKDVGIQKLISKLNIELSNTTYLLVNNIIIGYSKEYDVILNNKTNRYEPVTLKCTDSMCMQADKVKKMIK